MAKGLLADISNTNNQLKELMAQISALDPNAGYSPSAGENQYLANIGNATSARFANLGFGDSPFTGGQIASAIAPELSRFGNDAFTRQLDAYRAKSDTLSNYLSLKRQEYNDRLARKKKPWWQSLVSPILTGVGTAFAGPLGGAAGGALANLFTTKTGGKDEASYTFKP